MAAYADETRVVDARDRYFLENGFGADGGYDDAWVKVKLGPIPFAFPNSEGRKKAVPAHDLHHVATGYDTDLVGEAEIGAWEIASGCLHVPAAWLLNTLVQFPMLFPALPRVHRAFVRGRHSKNLYDGPIQPAVLEDSVGALRRRLGLDVPTPPASLADRLAFARFVAATLCVHLAIAGVLFGIPAWALGAFG